MNDTETRVPADDSHAQPEESTQRKEGLIQLLFEIFCACIFLGMIGLVFYNAFLRYVFDSSFPPSEEWARFLFIYITFFGAIEAFIHKKHIAVDLLVSSIKGVSKKSVTILASLCSIFALGLLLYGGIINVLQTMDTYSVATGVNMAFINGTLPIMALAAIVVEIRSLLALLNKPASSFQKG
ncbi:MAG: TRAP transporter small permease [Desulfovibrio sp.]|nr:TRAP transporter small permease [Desulfovibrio sp.]